MTSEEKDNLLDRYVTGQPMSADEEIKVNKLLDTDPDFQADYRTRQELFESGRRERRTAWEARQPIRPLSVERTAFPMSWAAAASVVLVLGLGLFWLLRPGEEQPLTGQAPLFEQGDSQLNLAGSDSSAVGIVTWIVTKAPANEYEFGQPDTLRVFTPSPSMWKGKNWHFTRLSEVRYRLSVDNQTYLLEQGRAIRLPLKSGK